MRNYIPDFHDYLYAPISANVNDTGMAARGMKPAVQIYLTFLLDSCGLRLVTMES
jgi:deoxyxylulose-5-phosphate synthase